MSLEGYGAEPGWATVLSSSIGKKEDVEEKKPLTSLTYGLFQSNTEVTKWLVFYQRKLVGKIRFVTPDPDNQDGCHYGWAMAGTSGDKYLKAESMEQCLGLIRIQHERNERLRSTSNGS